MGETDFKEKVQSSHYTSKQQTLGVGKQSPELLHYLNCPIKKIYMRDKKKQESVIQTQEKEQTLDTWGRGSSAVSLNKRMKLEISNRRKTYEMK